MNPAPEKEPTELKLRRQIAELEAKLDALRAKLSRHEAKATGEKKTAPTGLDELWSAALPKSRNRSSKHDCRVAWNQIPIADRPTIAEMVHALKAWNRSDEWKAEGNRFAPGLDKFIKRRMWEHLPEGSAPFKRHAVTPKPAAPAVDPDELVTDPEEMKRLLSIDQRRMRS